MQLHSDYPCLVDALGRSEIVRQIAEAAELGRAPLVLGLHGDWGTGKTSVLHQVEFALSGSCSAQSDAMIKGAKTKGPVPTADTQRRVKTVWFEAWRYQNEPVPVVALLHEMRAQLAAYQKLGNAVKKTTAVAVRGALLAVENLTKTIGIEASKVEQAGRDCEQSHFATALPSNAIREQLEAAIDQLLSATARSKDRRVVVFIDDLDRCEAEAAFRLLEGLKLYLTLDNCVFILGMNQQIVEDAIGKQMQVKEELERKQRAGAYLEKICQNIWRMPPVTHSKTYLLSLLPDTVYRQWIDAALGDVRCLPPNPRRLKGLANLLLRYESLLPRPCIGAPEPPDLTQTRLFLIVALLHQFHHDLFRHWQVHPELWDKLVKWCVFEAPYQWSFASLAMLEPVASAGNDTSRDLVFELLRPLKRVLIVSHQTTGPIPTANAENTFVDPSDTSVCWLNRSSSRSGMSGWCRRRTR